MFERRRRWRPASQWSALSDELSAVLGPITHDMVRRHIEASRERAIRLSLLTDGELEALGWDARSSEPPGTPSPEL